MAEGRKAAVDEIAESLVSNKKVKRHPLLIGKSGVGKTETVKAFVHALEKGAYPELKGKKVFYINTAQLVQTRTAGLSDDGDSLLEKISMAMGRHRDNIILVFDEIHMACANGDKGLMSNQFKTLLDDKHNNFPHVIGLTTEQDFYRDIYSQTAFRRRFKTIDIGDTDETATLEIIRNTYLKQGSETILEDGALKHLLLATRTNFNRATQPATSIEILSQCLQRTSDTQDSPLVNEIKKVRKQIEHSVSEDAVTNVSGVLPYERPFYAQIIQLENQLHSLEKQLKQEKIELKKLSQNRKLLASVKVEMHKKAVKVARFEKNLSRKQKRDQKLFLLLSHYLAPALEKQIKSVAEKYHVNVSIDQALVDKVIQEKLVHDLKATQQQNAQGG